MKILKIQSKFYINRFIKEKNNSFSNVIVKNNIFIIYEANRSKILQIFNNNILIRAILKSLNLSPCFENKEGRCLKKWSIQLYMKSFVHSIIRLHQGGSIIALTVVPYENLSRSVKGTGCLNPLSTSFN